MLEQGGGGITGTGSWVCKVGPGTPKCGQQFRRLVVHAVLTRGCAAEEGLGMSKSQGI